MLAASRRFHYVDNNILYIRTRKAQNCFGPGGDLFTAHGPGGAIDRDIRATALRNGTVVYSVAWEDYLTLGRELSHIAEVMAIVESVMLREAAEFVVEQESGDAMTWLMNATHLLATDNPECIVRESHKEIGEEAGISRETVSILLPKLKRKGLVERELWQHSMRIPDPQRLLSEARRRQEM